MGVFVSSCCITNDTDPEVENSARFPCHGFCASGAQAWYSRFLCLGSDGAAVVMCAGLCSVREELLPAAFRLRD